MEEQHVPESLEFDGHDESAVHYLAFAEGEPVGTARVLAKGEAAKIGRVAVRAAWRRIGAGAALMEAALAGAREAGFAEAVLTAQTSALGFYERLGFVARGDEFLEAGLPHFLMRRPL